MKIRSLLITCLTSLLCGAAAAAPGKPGPIDHIIVKWKSGSSQRAAASDERVSGLETRLGQKLRHGRNIGGGMSVVRLANPQAGTQLNATLKALRSDPDIEIAEPDEWVRAQAYTPSDPLFSAGITFGDATHPTQFYERQWYLRSGQIASIRADAAWEITKGGTSPSASPIVVAVIDTGVRLDHEDLAGKLLPGYDFVTNSFVANDGDGWDSDPSDPGDFISSADISSGRLDSSCDSTSNSSWHGTRVAGLIAANTDNALGMAGTGFNVRVLPVRALGKCGGQASDVIAGMYWAAGLAIPPPLLQSSNLPVNANPAQIINMSLGSENTCSATYATAVRDLAAHGVLVVASSGNEGTAVSSPANCAGALAVAGIRHVGTKVGYSNLGPEVGISAPAGNCVFVTNSSDPCVFALNTTTNLGTQGPGANAYSSPVLRPTYGTSFSSPLVAGTAGLMKAANPALTPALLVARIKESARAFPTTSADATTPPPACLTPAASPDPQGAECICNTQVCGAGMLDAQGAVLAAQRPAVLAQVLGTVGRNRGLTLDGSQSAAAVGRSIASYQWAVESVSGGATPPTISAATSAQATVISPSTGSYAIRLTVTDNLGAQDSALVTVSAVDGGSSNSPPSGGSGGGGALSISGILLATLLLIARRRIPHGSAAGPHPRAG